jgi:hypothetical protein
MDPVVILKWDYSPAGFFEEPIYAKIGPSDLEIDNGKVEARTPASAFDSNPALGDALVDQIESYFQAMQAMTHRPFQLTVPAKIRIDEKGTQSIDVALRDGLEMKSSQGTLEPEDVRRARLANQKRFRDLVAIHSADETLQVMIRAYGAAVRDPADEFIHLYEIRDTLKQRFGGEKRALVALGDGITETSWKKLGDLANDEPVRQGRHRGLKGLSLRPAKPEELKTARDAAVDLVNAYLAYLERP